LVNIPCSFKIDDNDLSKKKGGKPNLRIASLGHALHVWLNGEYLGKIGTIYGIKQFDVM